MKEEQSTGAAIDPTVPEPSSTFDYAGMAIEVATEVREEADRVRACLKRAARDIIEIGRSLLRVKEILPHGAFGPWLHAEFDMTDRTARNFMAVATAFGKSETVSDLIAPKALYLLASQAVSDSARQEALGRAAAGEAISSDVAREIVGRHEPAGQTVKVFRIPEPTPSPAKTVAVFVESKPATEPHQVVAVIAGRQSITGSPEADKAPVRPNTRQSDQDEQGPALQESVTRLSDTLCKVKKQFEASGWKDAAELLSCVLDVLPQADGQNHDLDRHELLILLRRKRDHYDLLIRQLEEKAAG